MKRKFISVALFGALLAASTSVTTSCKDYDDDISGLQGQITANATNLDELVNEKVNNLTQEINSLKAQEAALETALATAKTEQKLNKELRIMPTFRPLRPKWQPSKLQRPISRKPVRHSRPVSTRQTLPSKP
jgi:septal ring factor EnvC (AmiA/AmiB activator)